MWVIFDTNDNISSKSMSGEASNHKSTHTTKFEIQKRYCVLFKTGFTVAKHKYTFSWL